MARKFLTKAIIRAGKINTLDVSLGAVIQVLFDYETHQVWYIPGHSGYGDQLHPSKYYPAKYYLVEIEEEIGSEADRFNIFELHSEAPGPEWRRVRTEFKLAAEKLSAAIERNISGVSAKHAANLANVHFIDDEFHQTIQSAAQVLVDKGLSDYTYYTQWVSRSTMWHHPKGHGGVIVSKDGEVSRVE